MITFCPFDKPGVSCKHQSCTWTRTYSVKQLKVTYKYPAETNTLKPHSGYHQQSGSLGGHEVTEVYPDVKTNGSKEQDHLSTPGLGNTLGYSFLSREITQNNTATRPWTTNSLFFWWKVQHAKYYATAFHVFKNDTIHVLPLWRLLEWVGSLQAWETTGVINCLPFIVGSCLSAVAHAIKYVNQQKYKQI